MNANGAGSVKRGVVLLALGLPGILAAGVCGAAVARAPAGVQRVANDEYGFSLEFPAQEAVCVALSDSRPHGLFIRLGRAKEECQSEKLGPAETSMGIWADYNSTFERSLNELIAAECSGKAGATSWRARWVVRNLRIPGHPSRACSRVTADGSVAVVVLTQAGVWPDEGGDETVPSPYINYKVTLNAAPAKLKEALPEFVALVKSIQLRQPE